MLYNEDTLFSWETPEFTYKEKKNDWYWWIGALTIALIVLTIVLWKNYLLALLIFIGAGLVILQGRQQPRSLHIEIGDRGIRVDNRFIPFEEFDAFWIEPGTETTLPRLMIHSDSQKIGFDPIDIDPEVDIIELRSFLRTEVEEVEMHESLIQKLAAKIGI